MEHNDDFSMAAYLRTKYRKILEDNNRDKNIQNYFCSFILPYWDSILRTTQKEINVFLSEIFGVSLDKIEIYLNALDLFKNTNTKRDECLEIRIIFED